MYQNIYENANTLFTSIVGTGTTAFTISRPTGTTYPYWTDSDPNYTSYQAVLFVDLPFSAADYAIMNFSAIDGQGYGNLGLPVSIFSGYTYLDITMTIEVSNLVGESAIGIVANNAASNNQLYVIVTSDGTYSVSGTILVSSLQTSDYIVPSLANSSGSTPIADLVVTAIQISVS